MNMGKMKDLPIGGVITEGGTAHEYVTGGWRKLRPVLDKDKCTDCLICWVMCFILSFKTAKPLLNP